MTIQDNRAQHEDARPDLLAGWVIGVYLVLQVALLVTLPVCFGWHPT